MGKPSGSSLKPTVSGSDNCDSARPAAGLAANLRATGTGAQPSYWEQLADLATPTLLIAGELDHKFAQIAARMHEAMPDTRLEIVANAGHAVHLEQPGQVRSTCVAVPGATCT